jgi:hypothetical protein
MAVTKITAETVKAAVRDASGVLMDD